MPIRVLVVDDSAFMRSILTRMIHSDPELKVVGIARDGEDALVQIKALHPDVVTLDIEMPKLDGLGCLARVMAEQPLPVLMVSYLAAQGAEPTLRALELGAVDFVTKSTPDDRHNLETLQKDLILKIKAAALIGPAKLQAQESAPRLAPPVQSRLMHVKANPAVEVVAIGSSTGGPKTLHRLLPLFPADFPSAVMVAQHMPKGFTRPFAQRLDEYCSLRVVEIENGIPIQPGMIYIAPAGYQTRVVRRQEQLVAEVFEQAGQIYKPCVDLLFHSLAAACQGRVLAAILTGMGADGSAGMKALRELGARTIAEAEESCVIFGMPRAAIENGAAEFVELLPDIFPRLMKIIDGK